MILKPESLGHYQPLIKTCQKWRGHQSAEKKIAQKNFKTTLSYVFLCEDSEYNLRFLIRPFFEEL